MCFIPLQARGKSEKPSANATFSISYIITITHDIMNDSIQYGVMHI